MSRSRQAMPYILITLVVAALIALFTTWLLHNYKRVTKTIDLPPRGEAAYNPLYALKLALRNDGQRVESRQRLQVEVHPLKPADTVLMLADPRALSPGERDVLLRWVEGGGHLILRTPPPGSEIGDKDVPVLSELGVAPLDDAPKCMGLRVHGFDDHIEFCNGRRFVLFEEDAKPARSWSDEDTGDNGFARIAYGRGSVDIVADLDFLENGQLDDGPHYALARQLLQPNYRARGTLHLIYSAEMPSLFRLIVDNAWMLLLPLVLALCVWLWLRTERLGPLQPSPVPDRRSLLEHIQAGGDHLYRYGRSATLYAEVHEAFMRQLRRRDPYAAALDGPAQREAIARRTGMSVAEVEDAMRYPRPRDKADFVHRIAKLLQLRHRL